MEQEISMAKDSRLVIDIDGEAAGEALSLYLRAVKGRLDFAQVLGGDTRTELSILEKIRSEIFKGALDNAQVLIDSLREVRSQIPECEINLEQARIFVRQRKFGEVIDVLANNVDASKVPETTVLTSLQLMGHALFEIGRYSEAVEILNRAISLGEIFKNISPVASAKAFLILAYAGLNQIEKSQEILMQMQAEIDLLEDDSQWADRCLTLLRTKSRIRNTEELKKCAIESLQEAYYLAKWIGDEHCAGQCQQDLALLGSSAAHAPENLVFKSNGLIYLRRQRCILTDVPKHIERLHKSPVAEKIIGFLCDGERTLDLLFKHVWNLDFDAERHGTHLRATISKVRKLLPQGRLVVKDGVVKIS